MDERELVESTRLPRVHDLLQLKRAPGEIGEDMPAWARLPPGAPLWAVVRRTGAPPGKIAIGLRGSERHQRWGSVADVDTIVATVSPERLRSARVPSARRSLPAIVALRAVEAAWSSLRIGWGPGGSVGYELASGHAAVTPQSDLDLVLYAPRLLGLVQIDDLWRRLQAVPCKVDVRVETCWGGFSMEDYIRNQGRGILMRTADGPTICDDPWAPGEATAKR